ncbi:sugar ABC transporter permease [Ornithinimicrobium faecis]|uniref:Xylose transport system permease protein XylH n=1 Tax=Ornithinimicrobium faecis TaxID=2934158 RepID=A0ABY4YQX4_9MICO|nr:sugar ABC transporter permease [Ornithinimicrobium sp. HY1793]USQ79109.1 sugar ABC transporter permease [Ornithinimicrobium sp. HY1793]
MSEATKTPAAAVAADLADERLIKSEGFSGYLSAQVNRLRSGDLGNLPVILGLVIICIGFYLQNARFLSSRNIVSITQYAAPIGIIALGIVLVLLLGEIDLSVGSVSGMAAAVMAVLMVNHGLSTTVAMLGGAAVGVAVGLFYAALYLWIGIPSFVFSLAGLLGFQGVLLFVLGNTGTINLPQGSWLLEFTRFSFVTGWQSYAVVAVIVLVYLGSQWRTTVRRRAAGLTPPWWPMILIKAGVFAVGLGLVTYYVNIDRGFSYLWWLFFGLVVLVDFALRRTRWGRHVFAVGGNEEAARRSGIKVNRVYVSVFVMTSLLAAFGGLMAAGLQTSVSQATGTTDTNLTAIAAAVIGGTSLFGGRGTAWAALMGVLVLQAITSGLNLAGVESEVRFMVTGAVLVVAVGIDSLSRRARSSSGSG